MAAIRLARGDTGRDHVIVMQGGFNGSHNVVACNVLTPFEVIGPRVSPGEYKYVPLGSGVPMAIEKLDRLCDPMKMSLMIQGLEFAVFSAPVKGGVCRLGNHIRRDKDNLTDEDRIS